MKPMLLLIVTLWLAGAHAAAAVGFQRATAPDPDGDALQVAIWYPSDRPTADAQLYAFDMSVASNAPVPAGRHPLIVMSHGTGGTNFTSFDTAIALAKAGFIVAAVMHNGDNYRDQSASFTRQNFANRPRHVSRVIDFMLGAWPGRAAIDPARIGLFGHSAGGTTALVAAGGVADFSRVVAFCRTNPRDWGCEQAGKRPPAATDTETGPVAGRDSRVRAIVIAAPAVSSAFQPDGLAGAKVPVQLWVGDHDDIVTDASILRALLPSPPDYHVVANGGHFAFLAPCNALLARTAPEICADPPGFNRTAFLRGFQAAVIGFYRTHLK